MIEIETRDDLHSDRTGDNANEECDQRTQDSFLTQLLPMFPGTLKEPKTSEAIVSTATNGNECKGRQMLLSYESRFRLTQKLLESNDSFREKRTCPTTDADLGVRGGIRFSSTLGSEDEFFDALSHYSRSASIDYE